MRGLSSMAIMLIIAFTAQTMLSQRRACVQFAAAQKLTQANYAAMHTALGREPQPWELYMAHQQGAVVSAANLPRGDPNAPLAKNQLANNPFGAKTVGQGLKGWQNKWGGGQGAALFGASPQNGQNADYYQGLQTPQQKTAQYFQGLQEQPKIGPDYYQGLDRCRFRRSLI